jgi:DNA-binding winged helix-turn-helix (wHTH) protein/TolB-like protein
MEMRSRLRIGEWSADRSTNELSRGGETLRIEPKAMEVLMALAGRAGEAVSREELLAAVWPGVVVGDEALTQSIIKLRRALGDNPRSPSYIETISKRGYRLIAPVGDMQPPAHKSVRRRARAWLAASGGALAVVAAGAYFYPSGWHAPPAVPAAAEPFKEPTVTVLPFETVGAGPEQDYLARGIGSDLMTDLSRLSGLRLISPSGGQAAKGVRYVVSGSVQREAANLRINIRLTDARTDEQLWSQRFERAFGDLFAIQNEVTSSLVAQLPAKISDAERQRLAKRYTFSPEAYEHFLRAQALFLVRRTEDNREARAFYAKALELDPRFARAYAGLAMTHAMEYRYQTSAESSAALTRALELAESAQLIDPSIPEVYWALALVHTQRRRHDEALKALKKAIELNPSYADAYALMGGIFTYTGQPARTIPLLRTALRLNPDGGYLYFQILGRAYLFENDVEQALINLREALGRNQDDLETRVYYIATLAADGNRSEAEWEADVLRARQAGFSMRGWLETYPLTSARHRQRLGELLATVGL